jgi:ABC-type phosphate transport system substrate-binding protein
MNIKKLIATVVSGVLMFGFAASASADNQFLYGASAQFAYWKAEAGPFLQSVYGGNFWLGCDSSGKYCVAQSDTAGNPQIAIANKASFDGICAIQGEFISQLGHPHPLCVPPSGGAGVTDGYGTTCAPGQRPSVDPTTCGFGALKGNSNPYSCTKTICTAVTAGLSDVQAQSFVQYSQGMDIGPLGCATQNGVQACKITRDFKSNPMNATGLVDNTPIVVPFAFYVNNSVTDNSGNPIETLTPTQVKLIFSGAVEDWADLGTGFKDQPITVCLRHAGSGTHATLDLTQFRPGQVLEKEDLSSYSGYNETTGSGFPFTSVAGYGYFFNDGTGDTINCVNGKGASSWPHSNGAIAYADADYLYENTTSSSTFYFHQVNYEIPNSTNPSALVPAIQTGGYDFWSIENFYTVGSATAFQQQLLTWAAERTNEIDPYYAQNCEMVFWKANDSDVPYFRGSATYGGGPACPNYQR